MSQDSDTANGPPKGAKLYRQIIDTLRREISEGIYPAGSRLPSERELVERFNVSRLTVREALIGLEILGLAEPRQGAGVFATGADAATDAAGEDLDIGPMELTEARRIVETQAAALAAQVATPDQIAAMEQSLLDMESEESIDKSREWQADRAFHLMIAQASQNRVLVMMVETLWDMRRRSPLSDEMLARVAAAGEKPRVADHRRILDAIRNHDPETAKAAMGDHLDRVMRNLLLYTRSDRAEAQPRRETA